MITALFGLPIGDSRCRDYLCYWYVGVEENYFRKILSAAVITAESHHPPRLVQREQWVVNILAAAMWEADKCREGGRARPARTSCRPSRTHSRPTKTPRHSFWIVSSTTAPIKIIQSIIFALPCFRFCPDAGHGKIVCDGIGCFRVELVTAAWRVLESSWRWQQLWGLSSSLWSQRAVSRTPANQVTTTQQQRPHVTLTLGTHQLRPHQPSPDTWPRPAPGRWPGAAVAPVWRPRWCSRACEDECSDWVVTSGTQAADTEIDTHPPGERGMINWLVNLDVMPSAVLSNVMSLV